MDYLLPVKEVFKKYHTSSSGLSAAEARRRLTLYSFNELPSAKEPSQAGIVLAQFKNPLVLVLVAAFGLTLTLKDWTDSLVIVLALILNTVVGYFQEYKAQQALAALRRTLSPQCRVIRGGRLLLVPGREVVPGDILVLNAGDKVGADVRLFEANELRLNEAALTGESAPVRKVINVLDTEKSLGDRLNMAYWGTAVVGGSGKGIVVATGIKTEIGQVSQLLKDTEEGPTPLQNRLQSFSKNLMLVIIALCLVIFALGIARGRSALEMTVTSVALAVAAVPEGLVVTLTVILALGMQRIYQRKALLRKLVAAETLGSTTVICTDKTGTLTEGRMMTVEWETTHQERGLLAAVLCNDLANPTDLALWEGAGAVNHCDPQMMFDDHPRLAVIPFSSARKYMVTLNQFPELDGREGLVLALAKGAPEVMLRWSKLAAADRERWEKLATNWAGSGQRVLGLAGKTVTLASDLPVLEQLDATLGVGFEFLGLVSLADPLRPEAAESLRICQEAGMRLVVVTGDYRLTAEAIMKQLGVEVDSSEVMDGQELQKISETDLAQRIDQVKLFARVSPADKLRIVAALQQKGEVVAMTGDGINDAPALKKADIGIVVGEATEVAKEMADMVLLDSNFRTIVGAVEEGRNIFERMKKIIVYLLASSFSEVILVSGSLLLGLPLPITAAQILWVNLVEDSLPSIALAFDPSEPEVMSDPPRKREAPLLDLEMKILIFIVGITTDIGLLILAAFFVHYYDSLVHVRSLIFVALAIDSLMYVYACRSFRKSLWHEGTFRNHYLNGAVLLSFLMLLASFYLPPLKSLLELTYLTRLDWVLLLSIGLVKLGAIEAVKWAFISSSKLKVKS